MMQNKLAFRDWFYKQPICYSMDEFLWTIL